MSSHVSIGGCEPEAAIAFKNSGIYKVEQISHASGQSIESLGKAFAECLKSYNIVINPGYDRRSKSTRYEVLFLEGIECEKLEPNSPGWVKGRLKLTLQFDFVPNLEEVDVAGDEDVVSEKPASDLDEFRQ